MAKPIVAVVGRPNVGKSTMVNRIAQTNAAIVHESRGVTRDRSYRDADWSGTDFVLVDTGGIESLKSDDCFAMPIRDQAIEACAEADVIIFIVDGVVGITEEDETVARILRRSGKPVFLCVNKQDDPAHGEERVWEFFALGLGDPRSVSALHGHGTGDLLDDIIAVLPSESEQRDSSDNTLGVAIIGRPNVGKSSLINRISGTKRSIVSEIAGTTRDSLDIVVSHEGRNYRLIDTAGMRKKSVVHEHVEYYSMVRGLRAIDEADVCLLVVDASEGVTEQDQKVASMAIERGCALVVLLNKWDLMASDEDRQTLEESLVRRLPFASWAPILRISALTGRSLEKIYGLIDQVAQAHATRISTSRLNDLLSQIRESGHSISEGKRRLKIHYVTQTGTEPPEFSFFCNHPDIVNDNYERYLENRLRDTFDFSGTPIRLKFRRKDSA